MRRIRESATIGIGLVQHQIARSCSIVQWGSRHFFIRRSIGGETRGDAPGLVLA